MDVSNMWVRVSLFPSHFTCSDMAWGTESNIIQRLPEGLFFFPVPHDQLAPVVTQSPLSDVISKGHQQEPVWAAFCREICEPESDALLYSVCMIAGSSSGGGYLHFLNLQESMKRLGGGHDARGQQRKTRATQDKVSGRSKPYSWSDRDDESSDGVSPKPALAQTTWPRPSLTLSAEVAQFSATSPHHAVLTALFFFCTLQLQGSRRDLLACGRGIAEDNKVHAGRQKKVTVRQIGGFSHDLCFIF